MQTKTLEVQVFYTPEGEGTCRVKEGRCTFLRTTHFGTREMCIFADSQIYRKNGDGFTVPCIKCPIHINITLYPCAHCGDDVEVLGDEWDSTSEIVACPHCNKNISLHWDEDGYGNGWFYFEKEE